MFLNEYNIYSITACVYIYIHIILLQQVSEYTAEMTPGPKTTPKVNQASVLRFYQVDHS